jgi:hypothetical protein
MNYAGSDCVESASTDRRRRNAMKRFASPLVNRADIPRIPGRLGSGAWSQRLASNTEESAASMKIPNSYVTYIQWDPGHSQPHGGPTQLEYHTLHEEIFILQGSIHFGVWYSMTAPAYMNHPPFWVHPTDFRAGEDGLVMLMRLTADPIVQFEEIADGWEGVEYYATGKPTRCKGVTKLQLDDLPWQSVRRIDGSDTDIDGKYVWFDDDDGWLTWLMRVPAGWSGAGEMRSVPGSDEMYVLEGDLTLDRGGGPMRLTGGSYYCDPDTFVDAGSAERSENGCTLIRWTRGADHLVLPAPIP